MKEIISSASAWAFIAIAIVWIVRQICAAMKLFGLKMDKRFIMNQGILMIAAIIIWFLGAWAAKSLPIDRCLDVSGRWNYEIEVCEY